MSHSLIFDVLHEYDDNIQGIQIPVMIEVEGQRAKTLAKLDTGAAFCIFKKEHAQALGLTIEGGIREEIGTANGGSFTTYGHTISLSALGFVFDVIVYFAAEAGLRRNVLGRRGWIDVLKLGIVDYERTLYASRYDHGGIGLTRLLMP
jgi:hypothetical protein